MRVGNCGTRARYTAGCRCGECRAGNATYQRERRNGQHGRVDAAPVRAHILALKAAGLGRRSIMAACDASDSAIRRTLRGAATVQAGVAARILSVDASAVGDHSLIPAEPVQQRIRALLEEEGFTKKDLARRLGSRAVTPQLHVGERKRVWARTALRIERLMREIDTEGPALPQDEIDPVHASVIDGTRWGRSASELAEELGISERTVVRIRAKRHPTPEEQGEGTP